MSNKPKSKVVKDLSKKKNDKLNLTKSELIFINQKYIEQLAAIEKENRKYSDKFNKVLIKSNKLKVLLAEDDENLGYGKIIGKIDKTSNKVVVKNILDRGDFLRRESK